MALTPEQAAELGLPPAAPAPRRLTAEEAGALGLPEVSPPAAETPSALARAAAGIGSLGASAAAGAASLGQILDPVVAGAGALGSYVVPHTAPEGASLRERFENEMQGLRRSREERAAANPNAFGAAAILEGGAVGPALAAAAPFSAGAPVGAGAIPALTRMGSGVADAALFNAASQGASNLDRGVLSAAAEGLTSPANLIGAAPGAAGELGRVGAALRPQGARLLASVLPKVTPSAQAKLLRREGVPLTLGQNNPDTFYAAFEQATADNPLGMHLEQAGARQSYSNMLRGKVAAPGQPKPAEGSAHQQFAQLHEGFDAAYAPLKELTVPGQAVASMEKAALRPIEGIRETTRIGAAREIRDALSAFPDAVAYEPGAKGQFGKAPRQPDLTIGKMIKVRKYLRDSIREARAGNQPDMDKVHALEHAEDVLTDTMEQNMPSDAAQMLRDTDRQYARLMTLERAVPAGKEDFTPYQVSKAAEYSTGRSRARQGKGGELQELGDAGQAVFDTRVKPTGMRSVIVKAVPGPLRIGGARLLNSPAIKASLLREPLPPTAPVPVAPLLNPAQAQALALARLLGRGPALGVEPIPTTASEDDRR